MMHKCGVPLLLAVSLSLPSPVAAQRRGVEIGGFVGYANYDNSLPVGNLIGSFGGRAAVHMLPVLAVEVDIARAAKNGVTSTPLHVWVVYNVPPVSRAEVIAGGGYVRNSYRGAYEGDDSGIAGFVGVRQRLTDMVAIRVDAYSDFIPSPANKSDRSAFNGNWGIRAGASVLLNRAAAAPR